MKTERFYLHIKQSLKKLRLQRDENISFKGFMVFCNGQKPTCKKFYKEDFMDTKAFKALNAESELPGQSELSPKGGIIYPD
jgi:hypothetical protein